MEQELIYVDGLKHIACHHFNRETAIVTLDQKDEDGTYGLCPVCDVRFESRAKAGE